MKPYLKVAVIHLSSNLYGEPADFLSSFAPMPEEKKNMPTIDYCPTAVKHVDSFRTLVDLAKQEGYDALLVNPGDALIYDSHPHIALPGAWTKLELGNELDHARDLRLEVFPLLNFSAAHDMWMGPYAYQVSTPAYYRFCEDLIGELCELFERPRYFHLGFNQETHEDQASLNYAVVRGEELFLHDLSFLMTACRKHGVTPWISSDLVHRFPHRLEDTVPKDVLLSQTPLPLTDAGLRAGENALVSAAHGGFEGILPTLSSYFGDSAPKDTLDRLASPLLPEGIAGFVADPFLRCEDANAPRLMQEIVCSMAAFRAFTSSPKGDKNTEAFKEANP